MNTYIDVNNIQKMSQIVADRKNEDMILNIIKQCHNVMYSEEALVGEKAMHDLMRLLFLRLLEPLIDSGKIDIMDEKYYEGGYSTELLRWSNLIIYGNEEEQNNKNLRMIWKRLLCYYPPFVNIFKQDKCFNANPKTLLICVREINKIDSNVLHNLNYDIKGEIYEKFINNYMKNGGKELGQYFTNRNYINVIYELLDYKYIDDNKYTVFDPCMGTGGFLTFIKKLNRSNIKVYGNDVESDTYIFALMNSILNFDDDFNNLKNVNSLHYIQPNEKYDLIMTNPPFGIKLKYDDLLEQYRYNYCQDIYAEHKDANIIKGLTLDRFKEIFPYKVNSGEALFLQLCMYKLQRNGKCAIVLPDGQLLFGSGQNKNIRKYLLDNFVLEKILFAPSGTFEHTNIKTCVFFFRKPLLAEVTYKKPMTNVVDFWRTNVECTTWERVGSLTYEEMQKNNYSFNYDKYIAMSNMNKVHEHVQYEMKTLGEVCIFIPKSKRHASYGEDEGKYNFYTSSHKVKKCDVADYMEELIIIGTGGNANIKIDNLFSCSADNILCKSVDPSMTLTTYIYEYLHKNIHILEDNFTGVGIKHINKEAIKSIQIPVPPIERQHKIIDECQALQQIMDHTEQEIKNIDIFIEKYNTYVLPVELKNVAIEIKTLGEVCDFKNGNMATRDATNTGEYPFYTASNTNPTNTHNDYCFDGSEYILFIKSGGNINNQISNTHGIGKVYYVTGKSCGNTEVVKISTDLINIKYLYYYLKQKLPEIQSMANYTTGLGHINMTLFKSIQIPIPPIEVQQKIIKFYEDREAQLNMSKKLKEDLREQINKTRLVCQYMFI